MKFHNDIKEERKTNIQNLLISNTAPPDHSAHLILPYKRQIPLLLIKIHFIIMHIRTLIPKYHGYLASMIFSRK